MKRQGENQTHIDDNLIDETIRTAYGFSERQLQKELDTAIAHSEDSPEWKAPDDEFQKIMEKIKERGLRPVPLEHEGKADELAAGSMAYRKAEGVPPGKRAVSLRKMWKILLVAAILGAIGIGFSLNAVGKGATQYRVINGEKNNIEWSNTKWEDELTDVNEAYDNIKKSLDIPALKLGYIPSGMTFEKLIMSENCGIMRFQYNGQYFHIYQFGKAHERVGLHGTGDKKEAGIIRNPWMNRDIVIYQEEAEGRAISYSVDIKYDVAETSYWISGIMEKKEFEKIVERLYIEK